MRASSAAACKALSTVFAAVIACSACSKALGIEPLPRGTPTDAGDDAPDSAPPPWSFSSASCQPCMVDACADAATACDADRACHELRRCLVACALGDVACRTQCEAAAPSAASDPLHHALDGCMRLSCTDECYGGFGLAQLAGDACEACAATNCAPVVRACVRSSSDSPDGAPVATGDVGDCERTVACTLSSIDPANASFCLDQHLAALAPTRDLSDCMHHAACPDCPIAGADFRCTGNFQWRAASGVAFDYGLIYKDGKGTPVQGLSVSSCNLVDCPTCTQIAPVSTDDHGVAHVRLASLTSVGFLGCFLSTGAAGTDFEPTMVVPGRPLGAPEGWTVDEQFTVSDLKLLAGILGFDLDAKRAQLGVLTLDCGNYNGAGVSVDVDGAYDARFYVPGAVPDAKATETGPNGQAGFVNVTPGASGFVHVTAKFQDHVVANQDVPVRPGFLTLLWLFPDAKK